jgi:hypothetical protein
MAVEIIDQIKKLNGPSRLKKSLLNLYLKSPHKLQYALAKFGLRHIVKKKKSESVEIIRH